MEPIDVHNHVIPGAYLEQVRKYPGSLGSYLETDADNVEWMVQGNGRRIQMRTAFTDRALRVRDMDAAGIGRSVESMLPPLQHYWAPAAIGRKIARIVNDEIAAAARATPERVSGMAMVPLQDVPGAIAELERCVRDLGIHSVQIGTNVNGTNLDDPRFLPFFEAARDLDALVFVHPEDVAAQDRLAKYYLTNFIGNPLESTIAIASLIFGGVLEAVPGLKLCFAHGGGLAPYCRGRCRHGQQVRTEPNVIVTRPYDEYFERIYFDTLVHDAGTLEFLVRSVGSSRVVLGTDYPADMGDWTQVAAIRAAPYLSAADKDKILFENAAHLLGIAVPA